MSAEQQRAFLYRFGPFRLDTSQRLLLRDKRMIPLFPKAFDTLLVLVENSGRLVEKDELLRRVWPDVFVEESNLANNISLLRKAFGHTAGKYQYIQTIPKRGYRFVAHVRKLPSDPERGEMARREPPRPPTYLQAVRAFAQVGKLTKLRAVIEPESRDQLESEVLGAREANETNNAIERQPEGDPLTTLLDTSLSSRSSDLNPSAKSSQLRSIAVLPFKLIVGGGEENNWGLGMADALITRLSNIKQVMVRPTSAVLKYDGQEQDAAAIAQELGVDSVLAGHIQRCGDRIRVTVQLVSSQDGAPLWAEKFEEQFTDIFTVEDRVSDQVARALMIKLTSRDLRLLNWLSPVINPLLGIFLTSPFHWEESAEVIQRIAYMGYMGTAWLWANSVDSLL